MRNHGAAFLDRTTPCHRVQNTLRLLAVCRTKALGGQVTRCRQCGDVEYRYHSCGDRHCPACGGLKRARWLETRRAEQLPVPYFHLVFTLPHELSALTLGNRVSLYNLLMATAWQTLAQLGADPKHLGAQLGAIAVLHTWGQQLEHHAHVHMIVPGGGIALDGSKWIASRPRFLLSVKVLGKLFRGKFLAELRQLYVTGKLSFAGSTVPLNAPRAFEAFLRRLYAKDWIVYAKEPFAGPDTLLKYLTRYTHRVALSNNRLSAYDGQHVSLSYKDYADGCRRKDLRLSAAELLRRFCLHIVPKGFVRVRHYGILTNRDHGQRLAKCRELLQARAPVPPLPVSPPSASGDVEPLAHAEEVPASVSGMSAGPPLDTPTVVVVAAPTAPASVSPAAVPAPCPKCGSVVREWVWTKERPRGREWQEVELWNTS